MTNLPAIATLDREITERAADPGEFVMAACERAKAWLAEILADGSIEQILEMKSQAEAIRVYTVQKNLGKGAELAAAEIVRRAERGIGLAIRRGQEEGTIRKTGSSTRDQVGHVDLVSPTGLVSRNELYGSGKGPGLLDVADATPSDGQFDAAITEAKEEGNLSRANVVRKVKGTAPPASRGEYHYGRRHIDHYRVLSVTVSTLEGAMMGLRLLDVSSIPEGERAEWGDQLREALRPLALFAKEMSP